MIDIDAPPHYTGQFVSDDFHIVVGLENSKPMRTGKTYKLRSIDPYVEYTVRDFEASENEFYTVYGTEDPLDNRVLLICAIFRERSRAMQRYQDDLGLFCWNEPICNNPVEYRTSHSGHIGHWCAAHYVDNAWEKNHVPKSWTTHLCPPIWHTEMQNKINQWNFYLKKKEKRKMCYGPSPSVVYVPDPEFSKHIQYPKQKQSTHTINKTINMIVPLFVWENKMSLFFKL